MKKALVAVVLAIVALVLLTQIDDDLSDDAITLLNRLDADAESESYLYLYGIFASKDENPADLGERRLAEYDKALADPSYAIVEYPDSDKLPLLGPDINCDFVEADCRAYLFSSEINIQALLAEHEALLERAHRFLEFDEYTTLSKPTLSEVFPPYEYIVAATRLKVIEAISTYKGGHPKKALEALSIEFAKLRNALELQDNLIGKLTFLRTLSEILDVSSIILAREGLKAEKILALTPSEKSFDVMAAREFGNAYYEFKKLDRNPEFFEIGGHFPGWITRMLFKPNMTINAVAPRYRRVERLAKMSPAALAQELESNAETRPSNLQLRNIIAGVLADIDPRLWTFVPRFSDFDAKLALFNQFHHLGLALEDMVNPYYGKEVPKKIDGSLCFNGLLEDKKAIRCLRLEI